MFIFLSFFWGVAKSFFLSEISPQIPLYTTHKCQTVLADLGVGVPEPCAPGFPSLLGTATSEVPSQKQGSMEHSLKIPVLSDFVEPMEL